MTTVERPPAATAADEHAVFVAAPGGDLLAIVTRPTATANGMAVILLRGGGWRPSSGPRRTQVRLARRLAASGFHAVRFSYHGVAESGGHSEEVFRLDQPFVDDVAAVAAWTVAQGLRPVLVGNCFGARTALSYAAGAVAYAPGVAAAGTDASATAGATGGATRTGPGAVAVAGLGLIVPPVHDFEVARRLDRRPLSQLARRATLPRAWAVVRSPARRRALGRTARALAGVAGRRVRPQRAAEPGWVSRRVRRELEAVVDAGVPVLFLYGDDDNYRRDFEVARAGSLGAVLERAGPRVEVRLVPGRIHGLTSIETQEATLEAIAGWSAEALR